MQINLKPDKKYLLKAFMRINKYSISATFVLTFIIQNFVQHGHSMRNCYMPLLTELIFTTFSFFISLACITIFLIHLEKVLHSKLLIFLSFFFLPLVASIVITWYLLNEKDSHISLFICALLLPVWGFIIYEYFKLDRMKKAS